MLSTVALIDQRRVVADASIPPPTDDAQRLESRMEALEQRLAEAESRASDTAVSPAVVAPPQPSALPSARPRKVAVASSRPVTSRPSRASDDVGTRVRGDWEEVKRGFREAGQDIRSGFADLGRRIRHSFE